MSIAFFRAMAVLDEVYSKITDDVNTVYQAERRINQALVDLNTLAAAYASAFTSITQMATDNPNDEAWQQLKQRKDKLQEDFLRKRTEVAFADALLEQKGGEMVVGGAVLSVHFASGANPVGVGSIRAVSASSLAYTAPGDSEGVEVAIANGETKVLPSGSAEKFIVVRRDTPAVLSGTATVRLFEQCVLN